MPDFSSGFNPTQNTGRERRTGGRISAPGGTSQRSQFVQRAVPKVQSSRRGLENFNAGIAAFTGKLQQAGSVLAVIAEAEDLAAVKLENSEQQQEAFRKATLGEPLTAEETKDLDYAVVYAKTLGEIRGLELADEAKQMLEGLPSGTDAREAIDAFLKNSFQGGTRDPNFNTSFLSSFAKNTNAAIAQRNQESVRSQIALGRQTFIANVAKQMATGTLTADDIGAKYVESLILHPGQESRAAEAVVTAILAGAGTNHHRLAQAEYLLQQPGSGLDGNSFADSFPDAWRGHQAKFLAQYKQLNSIEGLEDYKRAAETLLDDPNIPTSHLESALAGNGLIAAIFNVRGGAAESASLARAVRVKLDKRREDGINVNIVRDMLTGGRDRDPAFLKKHFDVAFKSQRNEDGTPFTYRDNPLAAAKQAVDGGVTIGVEAKLFYEDALSSDDAGAVQAALTFYGAVEDAKGQLAAEKLLDGRALMDFRTYRRRVIIGRADIPTTVQQLAEIRRKGLQKSAATTPDSEFLGTSGSGSDGLSAFNKGKIEIVTEAFEKHFGDEVVVNRGIIEEIMRGAKVEHLRLNDGPAAGDFAETVESYVSAFTGGLALVPNSEGNLVVTRTSLPSRDDVIQFSEKAYNPSTGETENLVRVYERDMDELVESLGGLVAGDFERGDIGLNAASSFAPTHGVYLIEHNGSPLVVTLGATVTLGGKEVSIPLDIGAARALLTDLPMFRQTFTEQIGVTGITRRADRSSAPPERVARLPQSEGTVPFNNPKLFQTPAQRAEALAPRRVDPGIRIKLLHQDGVFFLGYKPGFEFQALSLDELELRHALDTKE